MKNAVRILKTGSLLPKEHQVITVLEKKYGKDIPLKSGGIPSFSFSANQLKEKDGTGNKKVIEPFVLRTYDYPSTNQFDGCSSSSASSGSLPRAMAATSAQPPAVDRVDLEVNGETKHLCDGVVLCTCPLPIAIEEAMKLYPTRPLGVVLSLGFTGDESEYIYRTMETTRLVHPQLHFQRIAPTEIMESFSPIELDLDTIAIMEQQVKDYVRNTPRVKNSLKVTVEKLCKWSKARNSTSQELTSQVQSISPFQKSLRQSLAILSTDPNEYKRKKITKFLKDDTSFFASNRHSVLERQELKRQLFKSIRENEIDENIGDTKKNKKKYKNYFKKVFSKKK